MKRLIWLILLLSLGLNVGLLIRAYRDTPAPADGQETVTQRRGEGRFGGQGRRGMGRGGLQTVDNWMRRFEGLGLDEDQEKALRGLEVAHLREEFDVRRDSMSEVFLQLRDAMQEEDLRPAHIGDLRRRLGTIQAELDSLVSEKLLKELEILTPEQRKTYLKRIPWDRHGPGRRDPGKPEPGEEP